MKCSIHLINKSEFSWKTRNCLDDPKLLNGSVHLTKCTKVSHNEILNNVAFYITVTHHQSPLHVLLLPETVLLHGLSSSG